MFLGEEDVALEICEASSLPSSENTNAEIVFFSLTSKIYFHFKFPSQTFLQPSFSLSFTELVYYFLPVFAQSRSLCLNCHPLANATHSIHLMVMINYFAR